ncbi:YihY/virulence factor BrkB family protein [Rathayibacter sp. YIM 133350]|uniref:YihY/virulence factor BrkB family protein n=1 Tax=Rathayibacter sp. YIM 133350 TaxID=3131992 RepID=UPI00307EE97D
MTQTQTAAVAAEQEDVEPSGPQQLPRSTWIYILKRTTRAFGFNDLPDAAAALTYYGVLSIFPALIAIVAGFVMFGDGAGAIDTLLKGFEHTFSGVSTQGVRQALDELAHGSGWFALAFGVLLTLWTVSRYVGGFARAMNRIYEIDEGRSFRILKPQQLGVAVAVILIIGLIAVLSVVSGTIATASADALGLGTGWVTVWSIGKWPVLVLLGVLLIGTLYFATPNVHQRRLRWLSLGAVISLVTLVLSSAAFFIYAVGFSNYDKIYRSLAGALIFLIWMWIANLALLFGAQCDAEVERARQLHAGIAAEDQLQMPPRDERLSEKRANYRQRQIAEARSIRYNAAPRRAK